MLHTQNNFTLPIRPSTTQQLIIIPPKPSDTFPSMPSAPGNQSSWNKF